MVGEIKLAKLPSKTHKNVYSICYTKKLYPSLQKKFFLKMAWNVQKQLGLVKFEKKFVLYPTLQNNYLFLKSNETRINQVGFAIYEK